MRTSGSRSSCPRRRRSGRRICRATARRARREPERGAAQQPRWATRRGKRGRRRRQASGGMQPAVGAQRWCTATNLGSSGRNRKSRPHPVDWCTGKSRTATWPPESGLPPTNSRRANSQLLVATTDCPTIRSGNSELEPDWIGGRRRGGEQNPNPMPRF